MHDILTSWHIFSFLCRQKNSQILCLSHSFLKVITFDARTTYELYNINCFLFSFYCLYRSPPSLKISLQISQLHLNLCVSRFSFFSNFSLSETSVLFRTISIYVRYACLYVYEIVFFNSILSLVILNLPSI